MDNQSTDLIWDTITDSAKSKFDYNRFATTFDMFETENVPENILFSILVGYAEGLSDNEMKEKINRELLPLGLSFEESSLEDLLLDKREVFVKEIKATNTAVELLQQGRKIPGIIVQVESILSSK